LHFNSYIDGKNKISPSEIINIKYKTKQDHIVNQIYIEEGNEMSGSTVAAPFGNLILVGNVKDNHFLVLKKTD
jgi:arylesterase/paraoxonase